LIYEESTNVDMEAKSKAKTLTAVRLNPKQLQRITVLADSEMRSFAEMLRLLLDEALEARERGKQ
jgi:hypothetical protein